MLIRNNALGAIAAMMFFSAPARAHPMGNFSISHYAGLHFEADSIELEYLIDMAEIPTFQEMQQNGMAADPGDPRVKAFLTSKASVSAAGLSVTVDGHALVL